MRNAHLARVLEGGTLTQLEMTDCLTGALSGAMTPPQIAALLGALRVRGETVDELTGAALAVRALATRVVVDAPVFVDTCGTGGDGSGTFNISTGAAIVASACGVVVAKHGNRSVSSRCGSADVLEALGVSLELTPPQQREVLALTSLAFFYAPAHHPAFRHVASLRRELGVRTLFNLLGPLANPAGARHQVLGVFSDALVLPMARTLAQLGTVRALVVHGEGLDELSVCGPTRIASLEAGVVSEDEVVPEALGLRRHARETLSGGEAATNARMLREVLAGQRGGPRDAVLANAAAALVVGGAAATLREGVSECARVVDSGAAEAHFERFLRVQRGEVSVLERIVAARSPRGGAQAVLAPAPLRPPVLAGPASLPGVLTGAAMRSDADAMGDARVRDDAGTISGAAMRSDADAMGDARGRDDAGTISGAPHHARAPAPVSLPGVLTGAAMGDARGRDDAGTISGAPHHARVPAPVSWPGLTGASMRSDTGVTDDAGTSAGAAPPDAVRALASIDHELRRVEVVEVWAHPGARQPTPGRGRLSAALRGRAAGGGRAPEPVRVIAELKRRSPSSGEIAPILDPVALARAYVAQGAVALSVLTDGPHFGGSLDDLARVAAAVDVPVLRKDFITHPREFDEARAAGASAVLLIAALLGRGLGRMRAACEQVGLEALVEVHDEAELKLALAAGATLIGINNRDLRTFTVDLATTERLAPLVPAHVVLVAESGVRSQADLERLRACGVSNVLVGEFLVRGGRFT